MSYAVNLLPVAEADFRHMFNYIHERSPDGAVRWEAAFERGLERLRANPFSCGLAPESGAFDYELRQLLFRTKRGLTYRAVFRVDGEQVTIYRLRGPGQAPIAPLDMPAD